MASCGCFGNLVDHTPAEAFWRDVLLLLPASVLAFLGRPRGARFPWCACRAPWSRSPVAVGVFAWKAPGLPLDDLATRLKPGVRADGGLRGATARTRSVSPREAVEPLLAEGSHLVVIADLEDEAFAQLAIDRTDELFVRMGEPEQPQVLVLHPGKKEDEAASSSS